jgi:hypothetical protein
MLGVANCGFGVVPIICSEPGLFGPLHFNQTRVLLMEYMGIHAITELGSCAVEFEPFSQYALHE